MHASTFPHEGLSAGFHLILEESHVIIWASIREDFFRHLIVFVFFRGILSLAFIINHILFIESIGDFLNNDDMGIRVMRRGGTDGDCTENGRIGGGDLG